MLVVFRFLEGRQTEQECFYVAVGGEEVEGGAISPGVQLGKKEVQALNVKKIL